MSTISHAPIAAKLQKNATLQRRSLQLLVAILIVVHTLLLSSCLKEDMSDCPEQIRVYFDITTPVEADDINPDDVDRMNLYVFDDKGYYLGDYRDNHIVGFSDEYYIDCSDLLPGKYRFIAWAGKDEQYYSKAPATFAKGKTRFKEALLMLNQSNGVVADHLHHLFHSELRATVTYEKVQRFVMPLAQMTNTINIRTEGFPADNNTYRFEIVDNNSEYLFDSSFSTGMQPTFKYVADCTKDEMSQLYSSLNVMRLAEDRRTPYLRIYNETTGELLYPVGGQSGNLINLIRNAYPDNDFDLTHTYDIVLRFNDGGGVDVPTRYTLTILINGWEVRNQNNELAE